ncbi:tyrosine-type recombinase/integrase [Nostoc commune]|uniref:tyrosine-type recombinase/integrase n=1 Tax=Nostoc commune TaxID=1178 RepID=UPI0018C74360|nr:tyrosine-type recombinase/integrase [Nostoc commune]
MAHNTPPKKVPNLEKRTREHLLPNEVEAMIKAASLKGRHGHRDSTLILLAYRHGLRVSELVALRWSQVDFSSGTIHINRLKHGISSTHPLRARELRWLKAIVEYRKTKTAPNLSFLTKLRCGIGKAYIPHFKM